jgi:hypothetical protein
VFTFPPNHRLFMLSRFSNRPPSCQSMIPPGNSSSYSQCNIVRIFSYSPISGLIKVYHMPFQCQSHSLSTHISDLESHTSPTIPSSLSLSFTSYVFHTSPFTCMSPLHKIPPWEGSQPIPSFCVRRTRGVNI